MTVTKIEDLQNSLLPNVYLYTVHDFSVSTYQDLTRIPSSPPPPPRKSPSCPLRYLCLSGDLNYLSSRHWWLLEYSIQECLNCLESWQNKVMVNVNFKLSLYRRPYPGAGVPATEPQQPATRDPGPRWPGTAAQLSRVRHSSEHFSSALQADYNCRSADWHQPNHH